VSHSNDHIYSGVYLTQPLTLANMEMIAESHNNNVELRVYPTQFN